MKKLNTLLCLFLFVAIAANGAERIKRYVVQGGAGAKDGTSWANAADSIPKVLSDLVEWDPNWSVATGADIYVGAGKYNSPINGLIMADNVAIYGGYPAAGGATRDWKTNKTYLDGKMNKTRVLLQSESAPAYTNFSIVDGFIIQNGISGNGAAVLFTYKGVVSNCIIRNNSATGSYAIGIVQSKKNTAASATGGTLYNCLIVNNACGKGTVNFNTAPAYFIYTTIANNKTTGFINVDAEGVGTDISTSGLSCAGVLLDGFSHWSIGYNSIIYGNEGQTTAQLVSENGGIRNMTSCDVEGGVKDVQGGQTVNTPSLITTNPQFVRATTFKGLADTETKMAELENADFKLAAGSPCIGVATLTGIPTSPFPVNMIPTVDLAGNPRVGTDGKADLGAYQTGGSTGVASVKAETFGVISVKGMMILSGLNNEDKVTLFNSNGLQLYSAIAGSETMFIDSTNFGKGVVVITVSRGGKMMSQKVVL